MNQKHKIGDRVRVVGRDGAMVICGSFERNGSVIYSMLAGQRVQVWPSWLVEAA